MRQASRTHNNSAILALGAVLAGTALMTQPASAQRPGGFPSSGHSSGMSMGGGRSGGGFSIGGGRSANSFGGSSFGRSTSGASFGGSRSFGGFSGRSIGGSNFGGRSFGGNGFSSNSVGGRSAFPGMGGRMTGPSQTFGGRGFDQVTGRALPGRTFPNRGGEPGRVFRGAMPFPDGHSYGNRFGGSGFDGGRIPVYTAGGERFIGRGSFPYPGFGRPVFDGPGFGPGFGRPAFLGGYYYPNYVGVSVGGCYPSVFGLYLGFPHFIFGASVFVGSPYVPYYVTPYVPFECAAPTTVNNYYYSGSPDGAGVPSVGSDQSDYPADSYQAAFADIQRGWTDGNIALIRKHLRDSDTKISVFVNRKYSYTIAGSDFTQITRDALDRLDTASFQFSRLRKAQNGDVTAYATHVYRSGNAPATDPGADTAAPATTENTQPMQSSDSQSYELPGNSNPADGPSATTEQANAGDLHTVYVSYTLRKDRETGLWFIVAVDSSTQSLIDNTSNDTI